MDDRSRRCSMCNTELTSENARPSALRKGGYCRPCNAAYQATHRETLPSPAVLLTKHCRWCLKDFTHTSGVNPMTCGKDCASALARHWKSNGSFDRSMIPTCIDCGRLGGFRPHPKGQRSPARRCSACQEAEEIRRDGLSEARRRRVVAAGDVITLKSLRNRDGERCHICGITVRTAGGHLNPKYPTVDHLVPISDGGEHVWANVALAHRECNLKRGANGAAQLRLA